MAKRIPVPAESVALATLRRARGWSAGRLGKATGTSNKVISNHETGAAPLDRERLNTFAAALGFAPEEVELILRVLRAVVPDAEPKGSPIKPPGSPVKPPGSPIKPEGSPIKAPGSPVKPPGSPIKPEGSPIRSPGSAIELRESPVEPPGSSSAAPVSSIEASGSPVESPGSPVDPPPELRRAIQQAAARVGVAILGLAEINLTETLRADRAREDRERAATLWADLKLRPPADRRLIVENVPEVQTWAMSERLSLASARAAAHKADLALELAQLGLRVAELAPGGATWRSRLQGFAWAFVANARRVGGNLPMAEAAFATAWRLWREGAEADPGLLAEWRLFDLEGSLRRAQRRWFEALELHDRARMTAPHEASAHILLNKAFSLEQSDQIQAATAVLQEATSCLHKERDPRIAFGLLFHLACNECSLERFTCAERLLPEVRELAVELGNELDLVRVLWLTGRVAKGQGRSNEAYAAFGQVLREFVTRGISYDAALVALDLAAILLDQKRASELQTLAAEMAWIFKCQEVHGEAVAALAYFWRAVEEKTATAEMIHRVLRYLERARHDPGLRFEAPP